MGCTHASVGIGPRGALKKYKNEMFDKEQERPDSGYNRKAGGKELTLPNTQLCPLCYTFFFLPYITHHKLAFTFFFHGLRN